MNKPEFKEKIDRNIFHNDPKDWIETISDIFMAVVLCGITIMFAGLLIVWLEGFILGL